MIYVMNKGEGFGARAEGERVEIVYVGVGRSRFKARLIAAMWQEFERNGRRTLTPGKVRFLRRLIRRGRSRS